MAWEELRDMTKRQRRNLTRKAARGDSESLRSLLTFTKEVKKEVNQRLLKLEKANMDYGSSYNNLMFFLNTEFNSNRMQTPKQLKYDAYDMMLQNEQGLKFLRSNVSTVAGARAAEKYRISRLQEMEVLPSDFNYRKSKDFLRFLGSEEVSAAIDQYGTSDIVVNMLWDAYKKDESGSTRIMKTALAEYLAGWITFDEAMERGGIKVEDYYSRRPTS